MELSCGSSICLSVGASSRHRSHQSRSTGKWNVDTSQENFKNKLEMSNECVKDFIACKPEDLCFVLLPQEMVPEPCLEGRMLTGCRGRSGDEGTETHGEVRVTEDVLSL